jgi:predicted RND superfamily exporter protein
MSSDDNIELGVRNAPHTPELKHDTEEAATALNSTSTMARTSSEPQNVGSVNRDNLRATASGHPTSSQRPRTAGWLLGLTRFVDKSIEGFFQRLGGRVARNPWLVIGLCVAFTAVCMLGLSKFDVENDGEKLYTPQDSQAFDDKAFVESTFGYNARFADVYTTLKTTPGGNVATKAAILELERLYRDITQVTLNYEGVVYNFTSLCYRPNPSSPCAMVSVLDFWAYNRTAIEADNDVLATINAKINAGVVLDQLNRPIRIDGVLGGITRSSPTAITGVAALKLSIRMRNQKFEKGGEARDHIVDEFDVLVSDLVNFQYTSSVINNDVLSAGGEQDEFQNAINEDVGLLPLGYVFLIIYGSLALARRNPVKSRGALAVCSVLAAALALGASLGIGLTIGIEFSLVVQSLALLVLGIAVDDTFVIVDALRQTSPKLDDEERIAIALGRAGSSITVTSLTDVVAFCTGMFSSLPALQAFSAYAALAIGIDYVFQCTFVVACMAIDMRRQRANRVDYFCCCHADPTVPYCNACAPSADARLHDREMQHEMSRSGSTQDRRVQDQPAPALERPITAADPNVFDENEPGIVSSFIGEKLPKFTLHITGKITIVLVTLLLVSFAAYGVSKVETEFKLEWFAPGDSYLHDSYTIRDTYFGGRALPFGVYTKQADYGSNAIQDALVSVATNVDASQYVLTGSIQSWYVQFQDWLQNRSSHIGSLVGGRAPDSATFHTYLVEWLSLTEGQPYVDSIVFTDSNKSAIKATVLPGLLVFNGVSQGIKAMRETRAIAATGAGLGAVSFSFPFTFFEGNAVIADETIRNVILAGVSVFVIITLLLASVRAALLVTLIVALVDLCLIGFLYHINREFNAVSAINLIVAVGLAVDYSVHICHSAMIASGSKQERAQKALRHIGGSVTNGALTTFLAILPMALSQSYIFSTFFRMLSLLVGFGWFFGVFLLPVLLSWFVPPSFSEVHGSDDSKGG